nr:ectoine hydroxylase [Paenalcaligenes faecalis]
MTVATDYYRSRVATPMALIPRVEPVVYARGSYAQALSAEQLRSYEENGFLVMHDVFDAAEVQRYKQELQRLLQLPELVGQPDTITEPGSDAIRSLFKVHERSELVRNLIQDPRLLQVARQILGSEVYLHQSRANFKPGFTGKAFYWHSDFETWHVEDGMPSMRALSCSVLLTDNNACNGSLMLVPGSHRYFVPCLGETPEQHHKQSLKKQEYGVPSQEHLTQLVDEGGLVTVEAKAGSVIFFDCNTMHGSANNISPWARSNLFMVFNSVDNALQSPKYGLEPRPDFLGYRGAITPIAG